MSTYEFMNALILLLFALDLGLALWLMTRQGKRAGSSDTMLVKFIRSTLDKTRRFRLATIFVVITVVSAALAFAKLIGWSNAALVLAMLLGSFGATLWILAIGTQHEL